MLQIKNISKKYEVGGVVTKALDNVSLNLRDNEFVAILGPSGSGKTTLLNIIGGLDRYDSGDLIIGDISTKKYKDRDWDSYRNHTIGFVFQSYNLIPHQTVLANVELALTISGISRAERKRRAKKALEQVGLGNQLSKKPNQMSGGQMQRVAIARALVNDPDILLADEPTGALDSDTSVAVMELLKEVAKDRLVVMVTHNPELAQEYATRIVRVKDGMIVDDSDPFKIKKENENEAMHKNMGKSSMSFKTALSLSFNNLLTKKGRTLLTSFAGSIGIIGIALILALSNGVNTYITNLEKDTLSEYPIQISKSEMDFTSMMVDTAEYMSTYEEEVESDEVKELRTLKGYLTQTNPNDLKALKSFIESDKTNIKDYTTAIEYKYNVTPQIFRMIDKNDYRQINPDKTMTSISGSVPEMTAMMLSMTSSFSALPENEELYIDQYNIMAGRWPEKYNECVVILAPDGNLPDTILYALGLKDITELEDLLKIYAEDGTVEFTTPVSTHQYEDFLDIKLKIVDPTSFYEYDKKHKIYVDKSDDKKFMLDKVKNGENLKIVGVVKPDKDATAAMLMTSIAYPSSLTTHIIEQAQDSEIAKKQRENKEISVFTGEKFGEESAPDMESLFKFDTDALDMSALSSNLDLSSAFASMDMSSMMGSFDLTSAMGDMDLSEVFKDLDMSTAMEDIDLSQAMSQIDMAEIMSDVDICEALSNIDFSEVLEKLDFSDIDIYVSHQEMKILMDILLSSYTENLPEGESATFDGFYAYVNSEEGQQIIKLNLENMIDYESAKQKFEAIVNGEVYNAVLDALGEAMEPVIAQITNNFVKAISEQFAPAFSQMTQEYMTAITQAMGQQMSDSIAQAMSSTMGQMSSQIANAISGSMSSAMGSISDSLSKAFEMDIDEESFKDLMMSMMNPTASTYEEVLATLNYAEFDDPYTLFIFPKDFDSKENITRIIDEYNADMEDSGEEDKVITYTDMVGTLMSSVSTIVNTVSYVLIAFVAVSLIVSSIMIGIITYISVLERTKEIGILRAIGASKKNISQVFNAETFIIGLCSGIMGVGVSLLSLIPINAIIHNLVGDSTVSAVLPPLAAGILVALSVVLTLIGGLIPSKKAATKDPVTALRSE